MDARSRAEDIESRVILDPTGRSIEKYSQAMPDPNQTMEDLARECAVTLGVDDDTNQFERFFTGPLADLTVGRQMVVHRLRWLSQDETRLFESHFASRYLPHLFRACCSSVADRTRRRHVGYYDDLLRLFAGGALFGAFARGPKAPECFDKLVERLAAECPKPDELLAGCPDSGTTGFQCREAFGHLVGEIYFLLMQTTQNFPAAYPSTIRTLKEHAKTLSSLATERKLKMSGVSNIRVTAMAIFQLREIIGVLDGTKPLDTTVHSNSVVPWAGCELIVIADESSHWKGITAADCEELKEGEDMKACARCGTVRYCGRAHQVAHWKHHKKVCRKPEWSF